MLFLVGFFVRSGGGFFVPTCRGSMMPRAAAVKGRWRRRFSQKA
jgi:hypothetical protein